MCSLPNLRLCFHITSYHDITGRGGPNNLNKLLEKLHFIDSHLSKQFFNETEFFYSNINTVYYEFYKEKKIIRTD